MRFIVQDHTPILKPEPKEYPLVRLVKSNWDDYGYKTTFSAVLFFSEVQSIGIGNLKIMKLGEKGGYTPIPEQFDALEETYASLGGDLSYYEDLYRLGPEIFRPYLSSLRDIVFDDKAKARVEDSEGFRVSLTRFSNAERTITAAASLFRDTQKPLRSGTDEGLKFTFKTTVARTATPVTVDFDFKKSGDLPNRINALIGYNGTGKTRLLSNLAIVASGYGYQTKEDLLRSSAGRFVGDAPPFKTVVVISYSAFDTFVIPGRNDQEKVVLQESGEIFGYVYCGLRELTSDQSQSGISDQSYRLKTPLDLEREFLSALKRVKNEQREDHLLEILRPLMRDPSFLRIGLTQLFVTKDEEQIAATFRELSSGHKIVLKILVELTAHIPVGEPSLILVDEPETHLHPPLLAALLKSIRDLLRRFDGYAIVATHSPVVLQETPSRYVLVLRRATENSSEAVGTSIETFGESIGVLTEEAFHLSDGTTDWHETLKQLAHTHSIEELERLFGKRLGFAARSYISSVKDDASS